MYAMALVLEAALKEKDAAIKTIIKEDGIVVSRQAAALKEKDEALQFAEESFVTEHAYRQAAEAALKERDERIAELERDQAALHDVSEAAGVRLLKAEVEKWKQLAQRLETDRDNQDAKVERLEKALRCVADDVPAKAHGVHVPKEWQEFARAALANDERKQ
jgi:hypothetical protein